MRLLSIILTALFAGYLLAVGHGVYLLAVGHGVYLERTAEPSPEAGLEVIETALTDGFRGLKDVDLGPFEQYRRGREFVPPKIGESALALVLEHGSRLQLGEGRLEDGATVAEGTLHGLTLRFSTVDAEGREHPIPVLVSIEPPEVALVEAVTPPQ